MVIKPIALPSGKRCTHPLYDTLDNTLPPMGTAKGISLLFGLFIDLPIVGLSVCTLLGLPAGGGGPREVASGGLISRCESEIVP